jgi:hypothetical protein
MILTEGFDESSIDCILFARPTKSKSFYLQMLGRGTRLHPAKTDCLVIDLVGVSTKHNLITLPTLFGLPVDKLKKKTLLAVVTEEKEREIARLKALAQEREKAQNLTNTDDTDVYQPKANSNYSPKNQQIRFNWLQLNDSSYALSVNRETIFLLKQACGHFLVAISDINKEKTLLAQHLPLDYAQGVGEDYVRNLNASILVNVDAAWRDNPPSDKQISLLKKFNIHYNQNITKGQAANLISIFFAKLDLANDSKLKALLENSTNK